MSIADRNGTPMSIAAPGGDPPAQRRGNWDGRLTVSGVCFSQRLFADQCLCLDQRPHGIGKDLRADRLC